MDEPELEPANRSYYRRLRGKGSRSFFSGDLLAKRVIPL
jgi:hypothetical protein